MKTPTDPMYTTHLLAEHVHSLSSAPPPVSTRDTALRCILDLIGAAVAGAALQCSRAARNSATALFGKGEAAIWMTDRTVMPIAAVIANATAASALDLDDGHRAARGHPGACVVPTVLTLAPFAGVSADDVLSAIVSGYDVGVRVAAAQTAQGIQTRQSGRWAALAAVAAAASLFKVEPALIAQALSIAGVLAPNQQANGSSGYSRLTGNDVKEGIPWSAATGLMALDLARNGYTGPEDLLDHPGYYDRQRILEGLGQRFEICGTYFKPYACCRYIHPALDRLFDLVKAHELRAADIVSVEVETFGWALKLGNLLSPANLVDIQYSLPYCVAIAAIEGRGALAPVSESLLNRPDLTHLARQVRITVNLEIDALFPAETLAKVTVETRRHKYVSALDGPSGDPQRPMDWQAIEEKFLRVTRHVLSPSKQGAIIDGVLGLAAGELDPLLRHLRSPG
ncbi:MmgE/PrpD family protein [Rhizobium leguminosarum]|uniref:MmgE/PrpD family protein n=1 Tax=Rhizobium leguminosarum TaxID=384 RepID=UPI001C92038E|nr:MmgE/PrpD family protein [Rhizobium leguminosarum]MBY2919394.1 MmgE/PrpD family protein [Rhizobium leguminosarum]MBY2926211.1 MmgE/PrpD family protein [Rhizobium leguminosarum]MBY2936092.1 MmgE/PrpD family protein [Rhizobium leguminosarum]MBY2975043.1 MmgE/PrpD family protein [Rhizobium leguminosarum]MBY2982413.1 MmgE/PrpD family protein [Rhizobium leguminosarum]